MTHTKTLFIALLASNATAYAEASNHEISELVVVAPRVANQAPASGYTTLATELRFDPSVEIQSRGLAEGQSDVTVQGSVFENVGFKVGALNLFDPQTGHYVAEAPFDVAMLNTVKLNTGIDAALEGFNSAIATIAYSFAEIQDGGSLQLGVGEDDLNFQSLNSFKSYQTSAGNRLAYGLSLARSEGDGSIENGDHEFERASLQVQHASDTAQTDLILSYQDKFYGWPGAYTGFSNLAEVDETQTTLALINQKRELQNGFVEFGAYFRQLENDYDFDRTTFETGEQGSFEHETRVFAAGARGQHQAFGLDWNYTAQLTRDDLVRSTDLTNGDFNQRTYARLALVPSKEVQLNDNRRLRWRAGLSYDYSNQDSNRISPLVGVALITEGENGISEYALEYSETSQLPGYTALKSRPTGLFAGNANLGRETAKQINASFKHSTQTWQFGANVFARKDNNLVDWTFSTGEPFARQANPVDLDVVGLELFAGKRWDKLNLSASLALIDKDSEYDNAEVDASFYALNFAKLRATLALTYQLPRGFNLRVDNEYRSQEPNPLREGDDSAYLASAALEWTSQDGRYSANIIADNLTDSDYQPFPGTPASGRQVAFSGEVHW